jgi:hypothetical protein
MTPAEVAKLRERVPSGLFNAEVIAVFDALDEANRAVEDASRCHPGCMEEYDAAVARASQAELALAAANERASKAEGLLVAALKERDELRVANVCARSCAQAICATEAMPCGGDWSGWCIGWAGTATELYGAEWAATHADADLLFPSVEVK